MTDDFISDIRKRHEHDQLITDSLYFPEHHWQRPRVGWQAHNDRAALLFEVERLRAFEIAHPQLQSHLDTASRPLGGRGQQGDETMSEEIEARERSGSRMRLRVVPVSLAEANDFVARHHRHHQKVAGHKFSVGAQFDGSIVGVAIVGRPVSRHRDDGMTLEVTRLATDGTRNACSFLYGATARAAMALGYARIGTYILASETGASLRASGWRLIAKTAGGSWNGPSRARVDKHPLEPKLLFEHSLAREALEAKP